MNSAEFEAYETVRGQVCKLLADGYHPPQANIMETVVALEEVLKIISPEAASFAALMKTDLRNNPDLARLEVDYAKLFVGPFSLAAPPYGSVYLENERRVMGPSTLDVLDHYKEAGLEIAATFKDAPDHIAVELEFLHFLIFKEKEAFGHSDVADVFNFLARQKSFCEIHLCAWVDKFVDAVIKNAATEFYQNLAKATQTFLKEDFQALSKTAVPAHLGSEKVFAQTRAEAEVMCRR